jgi:hypothetical protein
MAKEGSTESYMEMRRLWHALPDPAGHGGVAKPDDAVDMATFFRNPSMYVSNMGTIKGPCWTPFCSSEGNPPPIFVAPWGEVPEGLSVPYNYKDEPDRFVPNEKEPGHVLQIRYTGHALAVVRNFVAMLKQYLIDMFPKMAPPKLREKYSDPAALKAYVDEKWVGWAGTYEDEEGNVRDAYGKVKTAQFLRDQGSKRHKRSLTEFIRAREVAAADGSTSTEVDPEPIDHTAITRGSAVRPMFYIDWVSFSDGKKASERGPIHMSFTAHAVFVNPFVEVASASSASTLAKLGFVTKAAAPEPAGETKDAAHIADGPKPEPPSDPCDLPMPPSVAMKRAPPSDDSAPERRARPDGSAVTPQ